MTREEFQAKQLKLLQDIVEELRRINGRLQTQTNAHPDATVPAGDRDEEDLDYYE